MGDFFNFKENRISLVLFGFLFGVFIIVFFPIWQRLIQAWASSDDYSHGFLIVPLSLYIIWQKRKFLKETPTNPSWGVFPLVFLSLFLYLAAEYAEIRTLATLSMLLFIGSSLIFLFGFQIFKICIFPLFLLLFMIPVPAQIYAALTIPLQLFVTKLTVFFASGMGVPILREGNVLFLPEHTLQVVQACSGLRSIMSLLTLGIVISYFTLTSNFLRTFLTLSAIPVAIMVNVARVLAMVIAFYFFNYDLTHGTVHTVFGTSIFVLAIVLFLVLRKALLLCKKQTA